MTKGKEVRSRSIYLFIMFIYCLLLLIYYVTDSVTLATAYYQKKQKSPLKKPTEDTLFHRMSIKGLSTRSSFIFTPTVSKKQRTLTLSVAITAVRVCEQPVVSPRP